MDIRQKQNEKAHIYHCGCPQHHNLLMSSYSYLIFHKPLCIYLNDVHTILESVWLSMTQVCTPSHHFLSLLGRTFISKSLLCLESKLKWIVIPNYRKLLSSLVNTVDGNGTMLSSRQTWCHVFLCKTISCGGCKAALVLLKIGERSASCQLYSIVVMLINTTDSSLRWIPTCVLLSGDDNYIGIQMLACVTSMSLLLKDSQRWRFHRVNSSARFRWNTSFVHKLSQFNSRIQGESGWFGRLSKAICTCCYGSGMA